MNYLDIDKFVSNEVIPIVDEFITLFMQSERSDDWFDNIDEVYDFSETEIPNQLRNEIINEIYNTIRYSSDEYNFAEVTDKTLDDEILTNILDTHWERIKQNHVTDLYEWFERHTLDDIDEDDDY